MFNYKKWQMVFAGKLERTQELLYGASQEQKASWLRGIEFERGRLTSNRFCVAVVGEFNRGKSSLINALLGVRLLPADVLPATAVFNRVVYGHGKEARAYLMMKNGTREEVPVEQLKEYVTKLSEQAHRRTKTIEEAIIEVPSLFLQDGVELYDTPGLNDTEHLTETTLERMQQVDVVLYVISADAALSMTEKEFIERLLRTRSIRQMVFAVTKVDRLNEEDRDKLLHSIREGLQEFVRTALRGSDGRIPEDLREKASQILSEDFRVYPLSSTMALEAYQLNDAVKLTESGYTEFRDDLKKLLTRTQGYSICRQVSDTLIHILTMLADNMKQQEAEAFEVREKLPELKMVVANQLYQQLEAERKQREEMRAALPPALEKKLLQLTSFLLQNMGKEDSGQEELTMVVLQALPELYQQANKITKEFFFIESDSPLKRIAKDCYERQCSDIIDMISSETVKQEISSLFSGLFDPSDFHVVGHFEWSSSPVPCGMSVIKGKISRQDYLDMVVKTYEESVKQIRAYYESSLDRALVTLWKNREEQVQSVVMELFVKIDEISSSEGNASLNIDHKKAEALLAECLEQRVTMEEEFVKDDPGGFITLHVPEPDALKLEPEKREIPKPKSMKTDPGGFTPSHVPELDAPKLEPEKQEIPKPKSMKTDPGGFTPSYVPESDAPKLEPEKQEIPKPKSVKDDPGGFRPLHVPELDASKPEPEKREIPKTKVDNPPMNDINSPPVGYIFRIGMESGSRFRIGKGENGADESCEAAVYPDMLYIRTCPDWKRHEESKTLTIPFRDIENALIVRVRGMSAELQITLFDNKCYTLSSMRGNVLRIQQYIFR